MPLPFNSEVHGFLTRAKVYCAKVLPLVFDNSLSYYESLLKFMHKLNECIDAINAQNLNIIEFEHMITLEIEKFESYVETRQAEFENTLKAEWETEKVLNQQFRADMEQAWHEYQNRISLQWQTFVQQFTEQWNTWKDEIQQDLTTFKNNLEEQQDDFEAHILQLQTAFEAREQQARIAYQNNLTTNMENWKNATASAFQTSIHDWETDTRAELETEFQLYINQQIGGAIATLQTTISQLDHSLSLERTARQEADQALSNRIDRLTPEGMIQSDAPDADNNSQLYVVDPTTQQRTNIYPVINPQGGEDDRKYFVPSQDEMQISINWETLALTNDRGFIMRNNTAIKQGAQLEPTMFAIRKSLIENATQDALHDFAMLDVQILSLSPGVNADIKITNGSGTSAIRYNNIGGISHLVIPVTITNNNNYDISQYSLQVYCSISQYLGGTTIGAGSDITVDSELSTTSTNPVQNRIITNALNERPTQTTVNGQLAQKADTSTVTALEAAVNQKANQSTVQTLEVAKVSWTDVHNTVQQGDGSPVNGNAVWSALQQFTPVIPDASAVTKGVMQMGSGLLDGGNGVANVQTATTQRKGIIQVGNNLSIDANSMLSVPDATDNVAGAVHLTDTLGNTTSAITSRAVNSALEMKAGKQLEQYAVRSDAPDSQGVSQFYKLDAQGNRTNVYPALSPVGSLNWVVPKIPSEASINDDIFISGVDYKFTPSISSNYYVDGNIIYKQVSGVYNYYLWINALKYGIVSINDVFNLFTDIPVAGGEDKIRAGFSGDVYGMSTTHPGYAVVRFYLTDTGMQYGFKILYG